MSRRSTLHALAPGHAGPTPETGEAVGVALRAVEASTREDRAASFLLRRARAAAAALPEDRERALLRLVLEGCGTVADEVAAAERLPGLLALAGFLEARGRLDEAAAAVKTARCLCGARADLALHGGRLARKRGQPEEARRAYRTARRVAGGGSALCHMAAVGEALLDEIDPEYALARAGRAALRARVPEAAAVALEERARLRRAGGNAAGALRDYLIAATRYAESVDRARVVQALADLLAARGDLLGAREALMIALEIGRPEQRDHARARLHGLSRSLGDELGRRRWRPERPSPLVSLMPARARDDGRSAAATLRKWRGRLFAEPATS